jgi:hypothetical protein
MIRIQEDEFDSTAKCLLQRLGVLLRHVVPNESGRRAELLGFGAGARLRRNRNEIPEPSPLGFRPDSCLKRLLLALAGACPDLGDEYYLRLPN